MQNSSPAKRGNERNLNKCSHRNALIRSHVQIYSLKNAPVPNVCAEWKIEGWGSCRIGNDVRPRNKKRKREKKKADEMMCRMWDVCAGVGRICTSRHHRFVFHSIAW
jgi:hypothetical protein